ncbi:MAG: DUF4375 domain-containing protein [Planctomycetes bacterium]|nr:DUF4375 domain-containing protein [Planctomycetota bacterium]
MNLLCVGISQSQPILWAKLAAKLLSINVTLNHTEWRHVPALLATGRFDAAILDVNAVPLETRIAFWDALLPGLPKSGHPIEVGPPPNPYDVLREVAASDWAQSHALNVWSHLSRTDFESRAQQSQIDLRHVRFYSQSSREVPPEFQHIQEEIADTPQWLGFDPAKPLPDVITAEWLQSEPAVYYYLEQYVLEHHSALDELPSGYRMIDLLAYCCGNIGNGGLQQFLGNSLLLDETGGRIVATVDALHRMKMHDLAELIERAIVIDDSGLPDPVYALVAHRRTSIHLVHNEAAAQEERDAEFDALDKKYFAMDHKFLKKFPAYARTHPEEFVHQTLPQVHES